MSRTVKCPQCGKPAVYSSENPYRPFCSHRCQLIDLGEWASEKFAIPVQDQNVESGETKKTDNDEEEDDQNG